MNYQEPEKQGTAWLPRVVWIIVGFNFGFIIPTVILLLVVPVLFDNDDSAAASQDVVMVVSNTPTSTPQPTQIPPTATLVPTLVPTEPPTDEPTRALATEEATLEPTIWPTSTPIPPTATPLPAPSVYGLNQEAITFHLQGWNNCGPANLAMGLSYFGWNGDQYDTAAFLKPNREDKNVSPEQMVAYVLEETSLNAIYRVAGTIEMLKWLVSNEFMVIVESGYTPPGEEWYGHYLTLIGYDDARQEFDFYDSNLGRSSAPVIPQTYAEFDANWQAFNRTYIVIYEPNREQTLRTYLGRDWNTTSNWRSAADVARAEALADQENAFAFFNLGTALTMVGEYENAGRAFDQAFNLGLPRRMMWYQFMPYEAWFQASRLDDVVSLAQSTITGARYVEESYYYLGRVYEVWGDFEGAIEQYELALVYNRNYRAAQNALERLGA